MSFVICPAHKIVLSWAVDHFECDDCVEEFAQGKLTQEKKHQRRLEAVNRYVADDPRLTARMIQYDAEIKQAGLDAIQEHKSKRS